MEHIDTQQVILAAIGLTLLVLCLPLLISIVVYAKSRSFKLTAKFIGLSYLIWFTFYLPIFGLYKLTETQRTLCTQAPNNCSNFENFLYINLPSIGMYTWFILIFIIAYFIYKKLARPRHQ